MWLRKHPRVYRNIKQFLRLKFGIVGFMIVLIVVFTAIFASQLAPHDPYKQDISKRLLPPSWFEKGNPDHLLGTDMMGRDYLSRIVYGARISLMVALLTVLTASAIGITLGLLGGYFGGVVDMVATTLINVRLAFPFILLALVVIAVLGPSFWNLILCLGITMWIRYAIVGRSLVMSLRERDFVLSARCAGCSHLRIILSHLLPNIVNSMIVIGTVELANAILLESFMSFLGLGVQPPTPSWGGMLSEGRAYMLSRWWIATFPGLAIFITALGINLMGDGLRDLIDPFKTN
jgi:peptide/nickel transport system permease protein